MRAGDIQWGRSEEGYVDSKCKRFKISPQFWGCVQATSYCLWDTLTDVKSTHKTQRDAKKYAVQLAAKTTEPPPTNGKQHAP